MGWIQLGEIRPNDGDIGGDIQVGKAASVRFVNPDLPGRLVAVHAYPIGMWHPSENGDRAEVTEIDTQTEFMICADVNDPDGMKKWSEYRYETLATRRLKSVEDAEGVALAWIRKFDASRDIHWNGEPF